MIKHYCRIIGVCKDQCKMLTISCGFENNCFEQCFTPQTIFEASLKSSCHTLWQNLGMFFFRSIAIGHTALEVALEGSSDLQEKADMD